MVDTMVDMTLEMLEEMAADMRRHWAFQRAMAEEFERGWSIPDDVRACAQRHGRESVVRYRPSADVYAIRVYKVVPDGKTEAQHQHCDCSKKEKVKPKPSPDDTKVMDDYLNSFAPKRKR